jgi:3-methyladenine DNA glycosylase AlkC
MKPSDPTGSSYTELVSVADTYKSERFLPKSFTKNLNEFGKKNQEVFLEYTEQYKKPMNVHAKIEIKNGQTVVTYYGTVTAKDGQTEEYNKQLVFDFILTKKIPEMFKG